MILNRSVICTILGDARILNESCGTLFTIFHDYTYSSFMLPSAITVLLLSVLVAYAFWRRKVPGALMFAIGALLTGCWMFGSFMERAALDEAAKLFWFKFQAGFKLPAVTAIFLFVCEYTWPGRWVTRRNLLILSIMPAAFLALLLTDDIHHLLWTGFVFSNSTNGSLGIGSMAFIVYAYSLGFVGIGIFIWLFIRSPQHRWPVAFMLTGQIVSRTINFVEMTHLVDPAFQLDVYSVLVCFLMYTVALFGFRILNPVSLAQQMAIQQMREGMLVLDGQGKIMDMNPTAQVIFGVQKRDCLGRLVKDLIDFPAGLTLSTEIRLGTHEAPRNYLLNISALKDWRGQEIGRLLLLYDNTEYKQAQAEINEHQRIQAKLQERERLSRELHDTLVQQSAAVRMQAEMAGMFLVEGENDKVASTLETIADSAQQMHLDLREYIFSMRSSISAGQSFFGTVKEYLEKFSQTWSIKTELAVSEELERTGLHVEVDRDQLFGILAEALTNIHKHASAQHVRVNFTLETDHLTLSVEDDGCGYDTHQQETAVGFHFGIKSMAERAQVLGGELVVHSEPSRGTTIQVTIPYKSPVVL